MNGWNSTKLSSVHIQYTEHQEYLKMHDPKVSRESDLRSVPYNRPVSVRSFVKNVKSLSENQHNF